MPTFNPGNTESAGVRIEHWGKSLSGFVDCVVNLFVEFHVQFQVQMKWKDFEIDKVVENVGDAFDSPLQGPGTWI